MPLAIVAEQPGTPEVLKAREVPLPEVGPTQVLVQVAATGVNFIDIYQTSGLYPVPFPFTPGLELAGTVVQIGSEVTDFHVGDPVASAQASATYAEYALVDTAKVIPVPDHLDLEIAAALPLQGMTAQYLCNSTFPVHAGQHVLVHAGAGGVGLLLTQMLKAKGAIVYTTVSTEEKARLSHEAGADAVLGYGDFVDKVRELTDGDGVDVVFDGVGQATFQGSLDSLRVRGMMVCFGAASGPVPPFNIQELNSHGSLFLTRPSLGDYLRTPEELRWRAGDVFGAALSGKLDVRIGARFPLSKAADAQEALAGRATTGKVLLVPDPA